MSEPLKKLVCPKCDAFAGLVGADGSHPVHEDCLIGKLASTCPVVEACRPHLAPRRAMGLGNGGGGPTDMDDWGSYYDHARSKGDHE